MPSFEAPQYAWQNNVERGDPLSHAQVNLLGNNVAAVDELLRVEHLASGIHNAVEVPWLVGRVVGTTGYIFDADYGATVIDNPATGLYSINVADDVIPDESKFCVLGNVNDEQIDNKPHVITFELLGPETLAVRILALSSSLGAGNSWAAVDRPFDVAVHAPQQTPDVALISPYQQHQRRDFLTEAATDWNAIVKGQAQTRAALNLEHRGDGTHNTNRVARAVGWFRPSSGPSFSITADEGVASVARTSLGVVTVTMDEEFNSTNEMACFPVAQPSTSGELVVVHGRALSTQSYRFFTYVFSGGNWARADRPFFSSFFGVLK